jgi:CheY-like chemotaxis protein
MIASMAGSVLVVDDDVAFLPLATHILEQAGVTVVAAVENARAALAAAQELKPDAALVDVGLPDRDGVDLGHELAALPWGPRVVLTSTDRDAVALRPGNDHLPFVPKEELPNAPLLELLVGK